MKKYFKALIIIALQNTYIIYAINAILHNNNKNWDKNNNFVSEIRKIYDSFDKVNINQIDNRINGKSFFTKNKIASTINIGFTLDINYVLETMITVSSIMATQNNTTLIRFHFGVTKKFTPQKMLKMYELRNKINDLTEFNFYYLKDSVSKMKGFHPKGEACPGKFELPMLLSDDIERIIIFDAGDLLVLRDLTEVYNYDMNKFWVLGTPEPTIIDSFMNNKYNISKYVNIGSILINVKEFKLNHLWKKFVKNKYLNLEGQPDQTLFNIIVPDDKKNYLPLKFGGFSIISSDENYDSLKFEDFKFKDWLNNSLSSSLPDKPNSEKEILVNLYNPRFIHQFYGKWEKGEGLSIYRLLSKYFINLAGITEEICKKKPGYCI
jgi:hypothetical protein